MALTDILDRIEQKLVPGMAQFFSLHQPDLFHDAQKEFLDAFVSAAPETRTNLLIIFEKRIDRLNAHYREFLKLSEKKVEPSFGRSEQITLARSGTLCDGCKKGVSEATYLKLFKTYRVISKDLDPVRFVACLCNDCEKIKRGNK